MNHIFSLLIMWCIFLQGVGNGHCGAGEQQGSPHQGEPAGGGPELVSDAPALLYTRDFEGGYVTIAVGDTIVFSVTITADSQLLCPNLLKSIEQNGNEYIITPDRAGGEEIHIAWDNLNSCHLIDAIQTVTGTMSVFPLSFNIREPFRLYYVIGVHLADYFDIVPGTSSTTTSGTATTSATTTASPFTSTTSSLPAPLCLAETMYGEDAGETECLRRVRDELLSKTPAGQELIRLYYQWNALLAEAPGDRAAVREEIRKLVDELLPVFEELLE